MSRGGARARVAGIGQRLAPPRFILFLLLMAAGIAAGVPVLGIRIGVLAGFDVAALAFILSCAPLFGHGAASMRASAIANDANRALLLAITGAVMLVILTAVASELMEKNSPAPLTLAMVVGSLAVAWTFSNLIYTLHYAHLFYLADEAGKGDSGGLTFPETEEPNYWDFVYFAFCLGMTFQTSDVSVTTTRIRNVVTTHCLAAFVFNLGIIAFTINVLGG